MRRLRLRRPRPKLIEVENPDGDLKGSPVELLLAGKNKIVLEALGIDIYRVTCREKLICLKHNTHSISHFIRKLLFCDGIE